VAEYKIAAALLPPSQFRFSHQLEDDVDAEGVESIPEHLLPHFKAMSQVILSEFSGSLSPLSIPYARAVG
jgi:hypothetical protein